MWDAEKIIRECFIRAHAGIPDEFLIKQYRDSYELVKDDLFQDKRWIFTLEYVDRDHLAETESDRNILMKYKYLLPFSNVEEVLDVNINSDLLLASSLSTEQGLEIGLSIDHERMAYEGLDQSKPAATYIDGILYASEPIKDAVVKLKPKEQDLDSETRTLLILKFSEYVARYVQGDKVLADTLKAEFKQAYRKTAYRLYSGLSTKYNQKLVRWYRAFYRGASY